MKLKTIDQAIVENKRVLVRCGFDVPFSSDGKIEDDERIKECVPTIENLIQRGAKVVLIAHNGRPKGKIVPKLSMKEVAIRLEELLHRRVDTAEDCVGRVVEKQVNALKPQGIVLLENLRFHKEEEENDPEFAQQLSRLGDVYVDEAFANIHRDHASMTGVAKLLPAYAGLRLQKEIEALAKIVEKPEHPFIAIIGGAKISDKIKVIRRLMDVADYVLLGGALANTILKAKGLSVGKSIVEDAMMSIAKELTLLDNRLRVPVDVVVAKDISGSAKKTIKAVANVKEDEYILDIGPDTVSLYAMIIKQAKTIVWGGPMGYFEQPPFDEGTNQIARIVSDSSAFSVAGGGDTLDSLRKSGHKEGVSFASTGGGAMLSFIEGKKLPALDLLYE